MTDEASGPGQKDENAGARPPPWRPLSIISAPKPGQLYWCDFWEDALLPEMWKKRPAVVVSKNHYLKGVCTVLPTSTADQLGPSAKWAHQLSTPPHGVDTSFVICNHVCTISNSRLSPLCPGPIARLNAEEMGQIMQKMWTWLIPPSPSQ